VLVAHFSTPPKPSTLQEAATNVSAEVNQIKKFREYLMAIGYGLLAKQSELRYVSLEIYLRRVCRV
jgi:hypothetical protein